MFLRHLWPALLWAGFILVLTLTPGREFPRVTVEGLDKAVHVFLFSFQSWLCMRGFTRQPKYISLRHHAVRTSLLACVVLGAATEWMQYLFLTDRSGDVYDFIANCAGAGTGTGIFLLLYGKINFS